MTGMIMALLAPIAVVVAFCDWCVWMETRHLRHLRHPKPKNALPCPHALCRNQLPRQGLWDFKTGDWAVEDCPVCGGAVQFRSFFAKSHTQHPDDLYLRVRSPEAKP